MRKISLSLALVASLFTLPAHADFTGKNAAGATVTFKNPGDCTSVVCVPEHQIVDSTGAAVIGTTTDAVATTPTSASAATAMALWKAITNGVTSPIPTQSSTVSIGGVGLFTGGVLMDITHGLYTNLLQGNAANAVGNPIFSAITDGTNGKVAVKAASTPSAATDIAQVVDQRPGGNTMASLAPLLTHVSGASAAITSLIGKGSAGNLFGFNCTAVAGAAAGFCIAYNGSSAPGTGALTAANVLDFCYFDTTARGCSLSRIPMAVAYSTGITILVSSAATPYTYTTSGGVTAAISVDVQ